MSFPQLGFPQYLSASQAVYSGSDRPGVLAATTAAAASGRPGGAELSSGSTAAITSVLGVYAAAAAAGPYSMANYSAFLPYTADLTLFSQMEYEKALKYIRGLLKTEPSNTQALQMEKLIKKAMQKDGLFGMAIIGGMALGAASLAGLIGLAIAKSKP